LPNPAGKESTAQTISEEIRFAVFVKNPNQDGSEENPRLEIDQDGEMTLRGPTTVEGDITVSRGGVEFGAGNAYDSEQPWRFYLVGAGQNAAGKPLHDQWRLELIKGGEFSIGYFSTQDKKFKHCLRIQQTSSDDSEPAWAVSIDGNLHVTGQIYEKVLVPPELALQAQTLVTQAFMAPLLGQVVAPRQLPTAKAPPISPTKAETKPQIDLIAREFYETSPALAKELALALVKQDVKMNMVREIVLELAGEDPNLEFAKELVVAVTDLIKPNNAAALKRVKGALDI